jgi:uncharacterized protein (TIGR02271 family)
MIVKSTTGERVGKVIRCEDPTTFVVEKGMFFPKDYELRYDHITGVSADGSITYSLAEYLEREKVSRAEATSGATRAVAAEESARPKGAAARATAKAGEGEVRIPLLAEELDVQKYTREAGHVKIHKGVKVEERHFTVPVRREEVIVEHKSAEKWEPGLVSKASSSSTAFQDQTIDVAVHEEDFRVGKHSVVREELVVRTAAHDVDVEGSTSLRREEAEVEDTRRKGGVAYAASSTSAALHRG